MTDSENRAMVSLRALCGWAIMVAVVVASPWADAQDNLAGATAGDLDRVVESAMQQWKIPGLAVAAIRDGEIVIAKGYGFRDIEKELPVTEDTLFAIGSNTKSFTATILGMLNDDGLIDWNKPVREYLPDFRMHDPVAGAEMTAVDLITHRSGLPRHDLAWLATGRTREQLYHRLRYLEPTQPFRYRFQYQNLMFMTAGYLAGQVADSNWEALVSSRIMKPLGMQRSNLSVDDMQRDANYSNAHSLVDGEAAKIPFRNIDAIGPAGSINSSVKEMMPYVQFHIDFGKHGQNRLLSENNAALIQSPQMVMTGPIARRFGDDREVGDMSYGLGLMIATYRGHKMVQHGGGIDGFISAMGWLPDDRIGVMVLTNLSGVPNPVPTIVMRSVFDRLLGMEPVDWVGRLRERTEKQEASAEKERESEAAEQQKDTSPSHELADYAGDYTNPGYGNATVTLDGDALRCSVVGFDFPLDHFHYDIFAVADDLPRKTRQFSGLRMQFHYDMKGQIDRLTIPLESTADAIEFVRTEQASKD